MTEETLGAAKEEALHAMIDEQEASLDESSSEAALSEDSVEEEGGQPVADVDHADLSADEPATEEDTAADANGSEWPPMAATAKQSRIARKAAARRFDSKPCPPALRRAMHVGRGHLPIRIYALAKELKIDNKKLVDICTKAGIKGKGSALASLTDEEYAALKAFMGGARPAVPKAPLPPRRRIRPAASRATSRFPRA